MFILYILLAIVVLLFMVLVHEFGHYIVGRMLGFKITEFSVGFGKALFSRKNKRGELISLRLFPLGGYCAFEGEEDTDKNNPDAFNNQAPWKRILVFLAGVTFNFATAVIFSMILLCSVGYDIPQVKKIETFKTTSISNYVEDSYVDLYDNISADERLQQGDVIISINGEKVDFAYGTTYQDQFQYEADLLKKYIENETKGLTGYALIQAKKDAFANYDRYPTALVKRGDEYKKVKFALYRYEEYVIVNGSQVYLRDKDTKQPILDNNGKPVFETIIYYSWNSEVETGTYVHTFSEGLQRAVPFSFGLAWKVLESLWQLVTFQLDISAVGGPVATISTIASTTQANPINLLVLIPLISANLAIFNVLPVPALDGSHVVFTLIEWIRKKPIKRETENLIHTIGIFVLFGAVILIDILHFLL